MLISQTFSGVATSTLLWSRMGQAGPVSGLPYLPDLQNQACIGLVDHKLLEERKFLLLMVWKILNSLLMQGTCLSGKTCLLIIPIIIPGLRSIQLSFQCWTSWFRGHPTRIQSEYVVAVEKCHIPSLSTDNHVPALCAMPVSSSIINVWTSESRWPFCKVHHGTWKVYFYWCNARNFHARKYSMGQTLSFL